MMNSRSCYCHVGAKTDAKKAIDNSETKKQNANMLKNKF